MTESQVIRSQQRMLREAHKALEVSARFLLLEAEAHRLRGEPAKAEPCERQAAYNRSLIQEAQP